MNIFNSISRSFNSKPRNIDAEVYRNRKPETIPNVIVLGYSMVCLDKPSRTMINNYNNL